MLIHKQIPVTLVPEIITEMIKRPNFHTITFDTNVYNVYFKHVPKGLRTHEHTKYHTANVTIKGAVTLRCDE